MTDVLIEGYRAMAADETREREAAEWVENLIGDVADDPNEPSKCVPGNSGREAGQ